VYLGSGRYTESGQCQKARAEDMETVYDRVSDGLDGAFNALQYASERSRIEIGTAAQAEDIIQRRLEEFNAERNPVRREEIRERLRGYVTTFRNRFGFDPLTDRVARGGDRQPGARLNGDESVSGVRRTSDTLGESRSIGGFADNFVALDAQVDQQNAASRRSFGAADTKASSRAPETQPASQARAAQPGTGQGSAARRVEDLNLEYLRVRDSDPRRANELAVQGNYQALLGREADPAGLVYWTEQLNKGMHIGEMQAHMVTSKEFADQLERAGVDCKFGYCPSTQRFTDGTTKDQKIATFRRTTPAEAKSAAESKSPSIEARPIHTNHPAKHATSSANQAVTTPAPKPANTTAPQVSASSAAVVAPKPTVNPAEAAVRAAYQNVLGRAADAGGLEYWSREVSDGRIKISDLEAVFKASDEYKANNAPKPVAPSVVYVGRNDKPVHVSAPERGGDGGSGNSAGNGSRGSSSGSRTGGDAGLGAARGGDLGDGTRGDPSNSGSGSAGRGPTGGSAGIGAARGGDMGDGSRGGGEGGSGGPGGSGGGRGGSERGSPGEGAGNRG
jgi:hypothetical protein